MPSAPPETLAPIHVARVADGPLPMRALEATPTAVCIADVRSVGMPLTWVNEAFARAAGTTRSDLLGSGRQLITGHAAAPEAVLEMSRALGAGRSWRLAVADPRLDLVLSPVRDPSGATTHVIGVQDEAAQVRAAHREAQRLADQDPLTGLANRSALMERLRQAVARRDRHGGTIALLFLDLDYFKQVNDVFGHDAGDSLLQQVPERLRAAVRAEDTVARLGGDEFVLLCEDVEGEAAAAVIGQRVMEAFGEPFRVRDETFSGSVSVGIVLADSPGHTADTLLANADAAMYRAKQAGGGCFELFDSELRARVEGRVALARDLRHALNTDQLSVHYQPIVDMGSQRIVAVEALARWDHPERGSVPPAEFIPIAEETGVIVELGRWVLERACQEMTEALATPEGARVQLAVNLSPRQLADSGLPEAVSAALERTGVAPARLQLEITETALTREGDAPEERLWALKQLGVSIVLDDFGSGYSSIGHLRRFPIDAIKIDRSFVAGLGTRSPDAAIVGALLPMARALSLDVVAEGVETEDKLAHLYALGCRHAQGFFFAHPAPAAEVAPMVAAGELGVPRPVRAALKPHQTRFKTALAAGDAAGATTAVRAALASGASGIAVQEDVIGPSLRWIGEEWEQGRLSVADEHLATAIAERVLGFVFEAVRDDRRPGAGRVVLAAPEGEHHVLGLRMTADALSASGFDVVYLGPDVPEEAFLAAIQRHSPDIVFLTATMSTTARRLVSLARRLTSRDAEIRVIAGGPAVPVAAMLRLGAEVAESVDQALQLVEPARENVPATTPA
jgi:diguanylate cyclase (GGDEF)-like protein